MWHRISKANSMFYAKKALFCDPKLPVKRRIDAFYSTCVPAALHGAGEWAYTQSMFPGTAHLGTGEASSSPVPAQETKRVLGRLHETYWCHYGSAAEETQSTSLANFGNETSTYCCLADGELPERCERSQILGRICDMALRRNVERRMHQTVQGGLSETARSGKTPLPNYWQRPFTRFLGDALDTETEGLQHVD